MKLKIIEIEKGLFVKINCTKIEFRKQYEKWRNNKIKFNDLFENIISTYDNK